MKILYLNIFQGGLDRFNQIVGFVKKENPDVLGMSELMTWHENNHKLLKRFLKETKFPYHVFLKSQNSRHHIGLFSKSPITNIQTLRKEFNHGVIVGTVKTKVGALKVAVTHLNHRNEDARLKEISRIIKFFKNSDNGLIMGDLNSLSFEDAYDKEKLLRWMKQKNITKFGTTGLRMDVTKKIAGSGFIDSVKKINKKFQYSVPTKFNTDKEHFTKLRLDYIDISKNLLQYLRSAKVIRTPETHKISDHFPVSLTLDF